MRVNRSLSHHVDPLLAKLDPDAQQDLTRTRRFYAAAERDHRLAQQRGDKQAIGRAQADMNKYRRKAAEIAGAVHGA